MKYINKPMSKRDSLKKEDILVSAIVPVYNVEPFLQECLDSLINQTYKNLEIVLVDDGSTDNSGQICDEYEKRDARIRTIHKQNGGLSSARNAGMEIIQGEYCFFVDSDDVVALSFVEELLAVAVESNSDMAACLITREPEMLGKSTGGQNLEIDAHTALEAIFVEKPITTSASAKLYKTELWEGIKFPVGYIYEDYATIYKIILRCKGVVVVPKQLLFYRPNPSSITGMAFYPERMQYFEITNTIRPVIKEAYPDLLYALDNRTVRYAISYYKQISASNYRNEETLKYLRGIIREGLRNYISSGYSPFSKAYGCLISVFPKVALKVFDK